MNTQERKAVSYVLEGRVLLTHVDSDTVRAVVRGGDIYRVTIDPEGSWCTCPYGMHHPGTPHSHTMAANLAVLAREEVRT